MEIAAISISIISLIVSTSVAMWGWWRHRNIYKVERWNYREQEKRNKLNKKLGTGKYTILHASGDYPELDILIGKLEK